MSVAGRDKKWERKNSGFLFWAFVPSLNFIPFLVMGSRVNSKKYKIIGWVSILLYAILFLSMMFLGAITNPYADEYAVAQRNEPKSDDYITYSQVQEKYGDTYDSIFDTPEYRQYQNDFDEYWSKEDNAELKKNYLNFSNTIISLEDFNPLIYLALYVALAILACQEKNAYLKLLAKQEDSENAESKIKTTPVFFDRVVTVPQENTGKPTEVKESGNGKLIVNPEGLVDVNTASEDEIASLKGLTLIDAKKAISAREQTGGFKTKDEFYSAINIKPHIMIGIDDLITVGNVEVAHNGGEHVRRHIDI